MSGVSSTQQPKALDVLASDLWSTIARVRDAAPRRPNDASTDEVVEAIIESGLLAQLLRNLAGDDAAVESINYGGGIHPRMFAGRCPDEVRSVLTATANFLEFHR